MLEVMGEDGWVGWKQLAICAAANCSVCWCVCVLVCVCAGICWCVCVLVCVCVLYFGKWSVLVIPVHLAVILE